MRGDGELLILVRDQGPGIAESQLEEVFKPFVRLDEARNTESGSVGLGLAIARTLVHQHGGELSLHNREEGGWKRGSACPCKEPDQKMGHHQGALFAARGAREAEQQVGHPETGNKKPAEAGFFNSC